jgi:uncharacterized membrane protein
MVLVVAGSMGQASSSVGGFVLIGPFPIAFGSGQRGGELALLSVVLGCLMLVLTLALVSRSRSLTGEGRKKTDK